MLGPLRLLCDRLERELDPALLGEPLDALDAVPIAEDARDLLRHAYEAGVVSSLRDVARDLGFLRWVEETCSERECKSLTDALSGLLGARDDVGADDPARLARVDPLPSTERALAAWAARYGVADALALPARDVLSRPDLPPDLSLLACALPEGAPAAERASLLAEEHDRREAGRYLSRVARERAALTLRETLWQKRPNGRLRPLIERLVALLGESTVFDLHPIRFAPARPAKLHGETGAFQATLKGPLETTPAEVRVQLAGYEQRPLHTTCSVCGLEPCVHARAAAGRLLDACLWSEDRLHESLLRFVARPSWQLFFAQADALASDVRSEAVELSFVLRINGERASVAVQREQRAGKGRARLVAPGPILARERVSDDDRGVLELLSAKSRTLSASYLPADSAILRALGSHPRVSLESAGTPLLVIEETLEVRVSQRPEGLSLDVLLAGESLPAGPRDNGVDYLLRVEPEAGRLRFAVLTPSLRRLLAALANYRGVLPKDSYPVLAKYLTSLDKVARVERPAELLGFEVAAPRRLLLRITPLPDQGVEIALWMRPFALSGLWPPGLGPELVQDVRDGALSHARRDLALEKAAADALLKELGCDDMLRVAPFRYRVESEQEALALLSRIAGVSERVELEWAEHARKLSLAHTIHAADLKVELFKRGAFFFPEGHAQSGETRVAFAELLKAARLNERFVRLADGAFAEIEQALFARLCEAQLCMLDVPRVPKLSQAASVFWLARLGDVSRGGDSESQAYLEAAAEHTAQVTLDLPPALDQQLRDYQREGVRFLLGLTRWAPGACLLDEMGLGKTIQSVALLVARRQLGPALVVCPTSLVDNWCRELTRFAPELSALRYRGKERRTLLDQLAPHAVLVVSYELLLRDREHFEGRAFASQIIDEAQMVKNARTLKARALASLDVAFRVALTGTPVENRLSDLWSLFHCVAPGLLGSWPRFRARFAVPIERYESRERAQALRALVAPFMLRRQKNEVLRELPARTEVVQLVTLSKGERALYDAALGEARRAIGKHKRNDPARRVHILAELTRLRQLACHPRLVIDDAQLTTSSKLSALLTLLDDVLPRGQRVLVFSQFVAHLALVREALATRGTRSALDSTVRRPPRVFWLDGSTPPAERSSLVARFQAGEAELFLISLKAGGTGLTLTAADYVVHLDPWWNPSAQDQASDRAHRIGQTRPVTIVKLVTENTIEERVLALHEHKRRLAASIVETRERAPERAFGEVLLAQGLAQGELESMLFVGEPNPVDAP
jgi:superfamily II DNA or RNA helicase